jgi:beta-glucosidase
VLGHFGSDFGNKTKKHPAALPFSAGYIEGVPRLGLPALFETDAGLGVATQATKTPRERTSLPSGLATTATWNRELAYQGGAMIGAEARASGFNVMLAGGVNCCASRATAVTSNTPAKIRCWPGPWWRSRSGASSRTTSSPP